MQTPLGLMLSTILRQLPRTQREADPSLMPRFDPDTISEAAIDQFNRFNCSF
jgi:hypothetical protein